MFALVVKNSERISELGKSPYLFKQFSKMDAIKMLGASLSDPCLKRIFIYRDLHGETRLRFLIKGRTFLIFFSKWCDVLGSYSSLFVPSFSPENGIYYVQPIQHKLLLLYWGNLWPSVHKQQLVSEIRCLDRCFQQTSYWVLDSTFQYVVFWSINKLLLH